MNSKYCVLTLCVMMAASALSACGKNATNTANTNTTPIAQNIPSKSNAHTVVSNSCAQDFLLNGVPPKINNPKLLSQHQSLCFRQFALLHSPQTKGPLWAGEYLTPKQVNTKIKRQGDFEEEERLPKGQRAELSDYKKSGYDRGHLVASANMSTVAAQQDSFSLANMVPQNPSVNQNAWRNIEEGVREWVRNSGKPAYVVTGVAFLNTKIPTIGKNKVMVPSHVYKAVYQPDTGVSGVYWIENPAPSDKNKTRQAQVLSVCEFEAKSGVNPFPLLTKAERKKGYQLPLTSAAVGKKGHIPEAKADKNAECSDKMTDKEAAKLTQTFFH